MLMLDHIFQYPEFSVSWNQHLEQWTVPTHSPGQMLTMKTRLVVHRKKTSGQSGLSPCHGCHVALDAAHSSRISICDIRYPSSLKGIKGLSTGRNCLAMTTNIKSQNQLWQKKHTLFSIVNFITPALLDIKLGTYAGTLYISFLSFYLVIFTSSVVSALSGILKTSHTNDGTLPAAVVVSDLKQVTLAASNAINKNKRVTIPMAQPEKCLWHYKARILPSLL